MVASRRLYRIGPQKYRRQLWGHAGKVFEKQPFLRIGVTNNSICFPELSFSQRSVSAVQDHSKGTMPGTVIVRREDERQLSSDSRMAHYCVIAVGVNYIEFIGICF